MGFGCGGKGELGFLAARLEVDSCGAEVLFFLYRLRGAEAPLFHGRAACFRVRRGSGDGGESRFLTSFGMTKSEGSGMTRFGQAFAQDDRAVAVISVQDDRVVVAIGRWRFGALGRRCCLWRRRRGLVLRGDFAGGLRRCRWWLWARSCRIRELPRWRS